MSKKSEATEAAAINTAIREGKKRRLQAMVEHYVRHDIEVASVNDFCLLAAEEIGGSRKVHLKWLKELDLAEDIKAQTKMGRRERRLEAYLEGSDVGCTIRQVLQEALPDVNARTADCFLGSRPSLKQKVIDRIEGVPAAKRGAVSIISERSALLKALDRAKPGLLLKLKRFYAGKCSLDNVISSAGFAASPEERADRGSRKALALKWIEKQPELIAESIGFDKVGRSLGWKVFLVDNQQGVA